VLRSTEDSAEHVLPAACQTSAKELFYSATVPYHQREQTVLQRPRDERWISADFAPSPRRLMGAGNQRSRTARADQLPTTNYQLPTTNYPPLIDQPRLTPTSLPGAASTDSVPPAVSRKRHQRPGWTSVERGGPANDRGAFPTFRSAEPKTLTYFPKAGSGRLNRASSAHAGLTDKMGCWWNRASFGGLLICSERLFLRGRIIDRINSPTGTVGVRRRRGQNPAVPARRRASGSAGWEFRRVVGF
jgi:hypothetical protein